MTVASWSSTEQVDLTIDGNDDNINVTEVSAGIQVSVHGGIGDDVIQVGNNDVDANSSPRCNCLAMRAPTKCSFRIPPVPPLAPMTATPLHLPASRKPAWPTPSP